MHYSPWKVHSSSKWYVTSYFVVPELLIKFNHNIVLINAMHANGIVWLNSTILLANKSETRVMHRKFNKIV